MESLETSLSEFSTAIQSLSDVATQPRTAFDLLGKGSYEDAWQAYLGYFLDPGEPHKIEAEFLIHFFDLLDENHSLGFSPPRTGLNSGDTVSVSLERQSDDDNRPDIIVTSGNEWFLCLELKVHSTEASGKLPQTDRYANDPDIVPSGTENYEHGGYIYLKPADAPSATSDEFTDVDWEELQTVLDRTIAAVSGHAPARTVAQLSDFSTLIDSQLKMTLDEDVKHRKDLYFEYRDAIQEAQDAIKPFVKTELQENWADALETDYRPETDTEYEWRYQARGKSYGQVRVPRWMMAKSGEEQLDIHWEHKPLEGDFKKGRLRFILELEEPDRSTIGTQSGDRYHQFREDIIDDVRGVPDAVEEPRWAESEVNPGQSPKKLIRFIYEYQPGDQDGYYRSLQHAIEDTTPVTDLVTELLDTTDYTNYDLG